MYSEFTYIQCNNILRPVQSLKQRAAYNYLQYAYLHRSYFKDSVPSAYLYRSNYSMHCAILSFSAILSMRSLPCAYVYRSNNIQYALCNTQYKCNTKYVQFALCSVQLCTSNMHLHRSYFKDCMCSLANAYLYRSNYSIHAIGKVKCSVLVQFIVRAVWAVHICTDLIMLSRGGGLTIC